MAAAVPARAPASVPGDMLEELQEQDDEGPDGVEDVAVEHEALAGSPAGEERCQYDVSCMSLKKKHRLDKGSFIFFSGAFGDGGRLRIENQNNAPPSSGFNMVKKPEVMVSPALISIK